MIPWLGNKILHAVGVAKDKPKHPRTNIAQHPQQDRWLYAGADVISILQKDTEAQRKQARNWKQDALL